MALQDFRRTGSAANATETIGNSAEVEYISYIISTTATGTTKVTYEWTSTPGAQHQFTLTTAGGTLTRSFVSLESALQLVAQRNFGTTANPDIREVSLAYAVFAAVD